MIYRILSRLGALLVTLLGVSIATFVFVRLIPGDPVLLRFPTERQISPEKYAEAYQMMGLNKPLWEQYLDYLWKVLHGDFGVSIFSKAPVIEEFLKFFPATLELTVFAALLGILIGLPLGMLAALYRGTPIDYAAMSVALTGYSMPVFWWALLLIFFFSGVLGWTPVAGRISFLYFVEPVTGLMLVDTLIAGNTPAFISALSHMILPAAALATMPLALTTRQTRSAMLEVLSEDYIRTARAKGLSPVRVVVTHALRNALIPIVTVIGLSVGSLLAGAVLVESVFAWPGMGNWVVTAVFTRDYPTVQGAVFLVAVMLIGVNMIVDLLYLAINPRARNT